MASPLSSSARLPRAARYITQAPYFRSWYVAPWVQDDWKVTKRLTLNFGLRWDLNLPPDEKHNRMNTGFDPKLANPIQGMIPAAQVQR
jgi:outer membrane receptor for ferrienterochelin and colicin